MSKTSWIMLGIGFVAVLALLTFYGLGYQAYTAGDPLPPIFTPGGQTPPPTDQTPERISVSGIWECLPHKNSSGPQTKECAFGIAIDQSDGHYAIDTSLMSTYPVDYPTGAHVHVEGVLVPRSATNSSAFTTYDIDGIISATSISQI